MSNEKKKKLVEAISAKLGDAANGEQIEAVLDALKDVGHSELEKHGEFELPGFAKFSL